MSPAPHPSLLWDVFCRVIDNHGDLGVCWRLARELAARGQRVRLWVDDASALRWMAPGALQGDVPGVQVLPWASAQDAKAVAALTAGAPATAWVEAFGCEIPPEFIAAGAVATSAGGRFDPQPPAWLNLEYLSAEPYVERMHALPSPVLRGPAAGWTKWFFYPGFTPRTGGLLREADLPARQAAFDRASWLRAQGIDWRGEQVMSLFCYEPATLPALLRQLATADAPTRLLVTAGRASAAVQHTIAHEIGLQRLLHERQQLSISYLPHLPQTGYDELLWACDWNFVRGEDSLVRALWAGRPFVWQIYPQPEDDAHHAKLHAFLDWLQAPPSLRRFHDAWNDVHPAGHAAPPLLLPDAADGAAWQEAVQAARARLLAQPSLAEQLIGFVQEKG
ncbi:elongation factor P maturation arginine rhamnosyltransferase EarP [Ottowia oryzae]